MEKLLPFLQEHLYANINVLFSFPPQHVLLSIGGVWGGYTLGPLDYD